MESRGIILETFRNLRGIRLEWRIQRLLSLPPDVGYHFFSPSFKCCNKTWHFVMYPNGRDVEGCDPGYISIELWKSVSETPSRIPMLFTLGIKVLGRMKEVLLDQRFPANGCDFWRADKFLEKTHQQWRRVNREPDKLIITCTLRTGGAISEDGDSEMIERGIFVEEVSPSNIRVSWSVDYERLREDGVTDSRPFSFDNQSYFLKSQTTPESIKFKVFRKGPSLDRDVRWWVGLKRGDGSGYCHLCRNACPLMLEECELWTDMENFGSFTSDSLEKSYLTTDRRVTLFFRMVVERAATAEGTRSHGFCDICTCTEVLGENFLAGEGTFRNLIDPSDAVERPIEGDGTIREGECPSHKHVEWCIDNEARLKVVTSPEFVIGTQRYKLKLTLKCNDVRNQIPVSLHLISREPNVADSSQSVRWCAGVIRSNSTCNYDNGFGRLDLKKECCVWIQELLHEDSLRDFLKANGKFTIFFCMDDRTKFSASTVCKHGFPATMLEESHGSIEQVLCSHHCHVEWKVSRFLDLMSRHLKKMLTLSLMSPLFRIGAQSFKLQFKLVDFMLVELHLYIKRAPKRVSRSVRWWAGFKRADGTYLMNSSSGVLDPGDVHFVWTHRCLLTIHAKLFGRNFYSSNEFLIFFRINLDRTETEADSCLHSAFEPLPSQSKTVSKVECAVNKEIECNLRIPVNLSFYYWTLSSRMFAVGTQRFYFQLSCALYLDCPLLSLHLYSKGPADTGRPPSARWCAGLKREDGTYYHRNMRGELDLKETCPLWTLRGSQQFVDCMFARDMFLPGAPFTCFFRLSEEEEASNAAVEYIPDIVEISPLNNILKEERTSVYTQVEWTTVYHPQKGKTGNIVSPEFKIGTQFYILELSEDLNADNSIILYLYRRGSSVTGPSGLLQWWAGLKCGNGNYHHRNQRGELDLKESSELSTQIYLHRVCRCRFERELLMPDRLITVFFRLSKEQESAACAHSSDVAQQDFKRLRRDDDSDVVFKIKGEEFKMSRTIFQDQIPVFKSMFLHDTIEKRTGVASIEDVEPAVFKELLHYVSTGFARKLNVHNACALYAVAHKYLVEDLKPQCLQDVSEALSLQSFFDVMMLALRYGEDDLMKEVINFLSRNKNIIKTEAWQKFYSDNPEAADELRMGAFKHASVDSCHF